jgi:cytochrome c peroxidase
MFIAMLLSVVIPLGLDLYLPAPESNPLTTDKIELGRRLFNDRRLSRDGSLACASCHDPARAFSDGRPVSVGIDGRVGRRNVPAIINRGYGRAFFWDGRITTLEEQVLKPIEAPDEMDSTAAAAAGRVGLAPDTMANALASFVRSILSGNSRFDRFVNGERDALTAEEQAGLAVFRREGHCTSCHVGPTFTDEAFHNTGVAWRENGGGFQDDGRFEVTGLDTDRGAFKTPTLRDVSCTAPYMHDGSFATLEDVIEFYDAGGRMNPNRDPDIRALHLTSDDKGALVAFLRALTGSVDTGEPTSSGAPGERIAVPQSPDDGEAFLPCTSAGAAAKPS